MRAQLFIVAEDSKDDTEAAEIIITPDVHGLAIEVNGNPQCLVIDHSGGEVNVYLTNEQGEVDSEPIATLDRRPLS